MGQNHGLTPLEKSDFQGFEILKFLWPKKVSFLSRTLLNIICNLILTENKKRKSTFFGQNHAITPLEKCDFWDFERLKFLWPKKVSSLSRILLNIVSSLILRENQEEKFTFFDQKHGLTPLEKCDFWDFERLKFLWPKKVSFLSRTLLNIISSLILRENK